MIITENGGSVDLYLLDNYCFLFIHPEEIWLEWHLFKFSAVLIIVHINSILEIQSDVLLR